MTRDEFLEKLESLLKFKHKNEFRMYSNNLMVKSSKLFFDFYVTDVGMRGSFLYREILGDASISRLIGDKEGGMLFNLSSSSPDRRFK